MNFSLLVLLLAGLFSSCFQDHKNISEPNYNPNVLKSGKFVRSKGKGIAGDSLAKPQYVPIKSRSVKAGKPAYVPLETTYYTPGNPPYFPAVGQKINMDSVAKPAYEPTRGTKVPFLWPRRVPAQPVYNQDAHYSFAYFNKEQGLKSSTTRSFLKDRDGHIWIGSTDGLSMWDGSGFFHFYEAHGLSDTHIWCLLQDSSGHIWIGTFRGGINVWDGNEFTHYTEQHGLKSNTIRSFLEDRSGNIWVATTGGLAVWDGVGFSHFTKVQGLKSNNVQSLLEDRSGNIWIATTGGVSVWDGSAFTHYTEEQGLSDNQVFRLIEDDQGQIWIGTRDGGVNLWDGPGFSHYTQSNGLLANRVRSLLKDQGGNIWIGTSGGGISIWDGTGFTYCMSYQGLTSDVIYSLLEDDAGKIWIGTTQGINRLENRAFVHYSQVQGLTSNEIFGLAEDQSGNIWIGTFGKGINVWDGKGFYHYNSTHGLSRNVILSLEEDRSGRVWIGTDGGLNIWDAGRFKQYTEPAGLSDISVSNIMDDRSGRMWIEISNNGVSVWDDQGFYWLSQAEGLSGRNVSSLLEDRNGKVWIGSGHGVSVWNSPGRPLDEPSFIHFTEEEGLSDNNVTDLLEDRTGRIWIGTDDGGVSVWDGSGFNWFTQEEGLSSNQISSMVLDQSENIWLATPTGLDKISWDEDNDHFLIRNFLRSDGLTKIVVKEMKLDLKGHLWLATNYGLTRIDLNSLPNRTTCKPKIRIHELQPLNDVTDWRQIKASRQKDSTIAAVNKAYPFEKISYDSVYAFTNLPVDPVFPFDFNQISISWTSTHCINPSLLQYSFYLDGNDQGWSDLLRENKAGFQNLRPGKYFFNIRAVGGNGIWSDTATYSFRILPPWWASWWARSLYLLLLLSGFYAFYRWRTFALRKRQQELEKIVKDRTAEVVAQKDELARKNKIITKEKERSEELLLNILPVETAEELKQTGAAKAKNYNMVTVLFTDFKEFTIHSEKLAPEELVAEIDHCFRAFDLIMEKHQVEKIKTVGDAYLAAAGLPVPNTTNPADAVKAALELRDFMLEYKIARKAENRNPFEIRIGLHTGPVVAGIVGIKKFAYDIWGDTVNLASRMESNGEVGKINVSQSTYEYLKNHPDFKFIPRGRIKAKHKGEIEMYFVEHAQFIGP